MNVTRITTQRQPIDVLKEAATILNGVDALSRNVNELAVSSTYRDVPVANVEKIIRTRLALENVSQCQIDMYVALYLAARK